MIIINLFTLIAKIVVDDKGTKEKVKKTEKAFDDFGKKTKQAAEKVNDFSNGMSRDLDPAIQKVYSNVRKLNTEATRMSRAWGKNSEQALQARKAITDYALGLDDATFKQTFMRSQLGLTESQLMRQAGSIKLNARMVKLMGDQTQILTQRMQGLAKHGITPEMLLPASTPGAFKILNETLAVSGKRIYGLSAGFRAFGNRMEKVTKGWTIQKLAIQAANGDMVKYGLLMRGATAAMAGMTLAFPIVGMAAAAFYGGLIKSAIESDKQTKKLADTFTNKLGKAFEPMIGLVNDLLQAFFKFGSAVADIMIAFNEAHPVIAKFAQGVLLLLPAMTLLLMPLSLGFGLFKGWAAVIGTVSKLVMPLITVIGTASSTFLAFAGIIGLVGGAFTYLWNTNETFKNGVISAWNLISQAFHAVFDPIVTYLTETLPAAFQAGGLEGVFTTIATTFMNFLNYMYENLPRFLDLGLQMIGNILNGIAQNLPAVLQKGSETLNNFLTGIINMMPALIDNAAKIIEAYANYLATNLPIIIEKGTELLQKLVDGILKHLPALIDATIKIVTTLLNTLIENLPKIIEAGMKLLQAVVDGVMRNLPKIIEAAGKIIVALINALIKALPQVLKMGADILKTIVDGLIRNLPSVMEVGKNIVKGLWNGISGMGGWLAGKVSSFASGILKTMKGALGIHSPSREAERQIGKWIPPGIGEGIQNEMPKLNTMLQTDMNALVGGITIPQTIEQNGLAQASSGNNAVESTGPMVVIQNMNIRNKDDADYFADLIIRKIKRERIALGTV